MIKRAPNPKFRYKQKVKILEGFYKDYVGTLEEQTELSGGNFYSVLLGVNDVLCCAKYIDETNLEAVE